MELLQLRYFLDAAKSENFSETARRKQVPQSAVSQTIKKLEKELGVLLFHRAGNKVRLSRAGRILRKGVSEAIGILDDTIQQLTGEEGAIQGEIRLLIRSNRRVVTQCIESFKKQYPGVQFFLNHDATCQDYDNYDLWMGEEEQGNPNGILLAKEPLLIALSREHPLSLESSIRPEALKGERFISLPAGSSLYERLLDLCKSYGFHPEIAIWCDDPYYIRKYVAANLGIALFPVLSWMGLEEEQLKVLPVKGESLMRKVFLYQNATHAPSAAVKSFLSHLQKGFLKEEEALKAYLQQHY